MLEVKSRSVSYLYGRKGRTKAVNEDSSRCVDSTEQVEELCAHNIAKQQIQSQANPHITLVILKTSVLRVHNHHRTSQRKIQLISKTGYFLYTRSNLNNCIVFVQNAVPLQLTRMRFKMRVHSFPYI